MHRFAILSFLPILPLLMLTACNGDATPAPAAEPAVSLDSLTFENSALAARLRALHTCAAAEAGPDWTVRPYTRIGNFISARWCGPGVPAGDCLSGRETAPGDKELRSIRLETLFYPQTPNTAFGLVFGARYAPPAAGWEAHLYYSEGGRGVIGEGFEIDLRAVPYVPDPKRPGGYRGVSFGSSLTYRVADTPVSVSPSGAPAALFTQAAASPESLRDAGLALIDSLHARIESVIAKHEAQRCVYGTPPGNGIPPTCTPRALSAAEEQAELAAARAWLDGQSTLLRENAGPMHAAALKAFPLNRCWR